jgi:hypothetical protein
VGNPLWTLGSQLIEPIDELGVAATLTNEAGQDIVAIAPALLTTHAQHIELADEIAEDDCAVAGHFALEILPPELPPNESILENIK